MADITTPKPRPLGDLLARLKSPWTVTLAVPLLVALLDPGNLTETLRFAATALLGTVPFIAFAVLLLAYLRAAGAEAMVAAAFRGRETRMIVLAALMGGLAPFCSCEVIPFIAGLLALGAPLSAVMAFWLSSPLIDPPSLLITAGALGWPFAVGKAVAAVGIGLMGGFAVRLAIGRGAFADALRPIQKKGCGCGPNPFDGRPVWRFWREAQRRATFGHAFAENGYFLLKWMAMAYMLEAVLVSYVPASLIAGLVGGEGIGSVIVAALVGMPAYLNSYAAPPLLAGLIEQGMSTGGAMAFLVAGAVSSIPAMAAVWSLVRPPVFASYIGLGLIGAVLSGLIFQTIV